jgi:hypothetical protein
MGAISAGTICGEDGPNSAACKGAQQISTQVGKEVAANQVSGCAPIVDIAGAIGSHWRGLAQVGIAVVAVVVTVATAGADTPLLLTLAVGASTSVASYGAGCVGRQGPGGCTVGGAVVAASAGAAGAGLASGANAYVGGAISSDAAATAAQYSSVGVLSAVVASGGGLLIGTLFGIPVTGGSLVSAGLGSLSGLEP